MKKYSKILAVLLAAQVTLTYGYQVKNVYAAENSVGVASQDYSNIKGKIKQNADAFVNKYGVTSVQYAMMEDGNVIVSGNSGAYSKNDNSKTLTNDTMYGIGSTSKTFTTAAVMKLVDMKKVDLDKPVVDYIKDFIMADDRYKNITVRMLLNHSSGIMGSAYSNTMLWDENDTTAHDKLLEQLKTQRLKADPGKFFVYCNDGFTLAEILVERVSGQSFTEFIHDNITTPLKLDNTKTIRDDFDRSKLAKTYSLLNPKKETPLEAVNIVGAGGIYSTAEDLCKFAQEFTKKGNLLSKDSVEQMENEEYKKGLWPNNPDSADNTFNYGLGLDGTNIYPFNQYDIKAVSKGGDVMLYHSEIVILPEYNMSAAVTSSGGSSSMDEVLACSMLLDALKEKGIIKEIKGDKSFGTPTQTPVEEDVKKYEGTYGTLKQNFKVKIDEKGILTISNGKDAEYIYNGNGAFLYKDGMEKLTFEDKDGKTYLRSDSYAEVPEIGQTAVSQYIGQKLEDNKLTAEVSKAWEARSNKKYFNLIDKFDSETIELAPFSTIPSKDGYFMANKIIDENKAISTIQIPGIDGRDTYDCTFFKDNDVEYLNAAEYVFMSEDGLKEMPQGNGTCTIQDNGYNVWYKIGDNLDGKKITVQLPQNSGFLVYTKEGLCTNQSAQSKDNTAVLKAGGYVMFGGQKGAEINFTIQ